MNSSENGNGPPRRDWRLVQHDRAFLQERRLSRGAPLADTVDFSQAKYDADLVIPTLDNYDLLMGFLQSLILYTRQVNVRLWLVDQSTGRDLKHVVKEDGDVRIVEMGSNVGWERGLIAGLKEADAAGPSPVAGFFNDDLHVVPGDPLWLRKMLDSFVAFRRVGAVGPCSNYASQSQNLFIPSKPEPVWTALLIGFCMLVRRDVLEAAGGIATDLPGGDDLDLSVRIEQCGFRLMNRRDVFVYHHGSATGKKVKGSYWDSEEHQLQTRQALIERNGLMATLRVLSGSVSPLVPEDRIMDMDSDAPVYTS